MERIDKVVFGDNQFFGITHRSQEKAEELSQHFSHLENILKVYDLGADEYMVKPFSLKVLYAKCLALLSRSMENKKDEKCLVCGSVRLYPSRMQVMCEEKEVELAPKEYFLLKVLIENQGHVLGRDTLLDIVWGADFDGSDRVVDNHIKKLRQALGSHGNSIKTVIGRGYKIVP